MLLKHWFLNMQLHISIKWSAILFYGKGKDDQVPPTTFRILLHILKKRMGDFFIPEGLHSPSETELKMLMIYLFSR
jgi:hypothetical protein